MVKLSLDLEGVLANSQVGLVEHLADCLPEGPSMRWEDFYQWDIIEAIKHNTGVEIPRENHEILWVETWEHAFSIPAFPGARTVCEWLTERGIKFDVVTVSYPGCIANKNKWIAKNLGNYNVVHLTNQKKYELDYDVFVDDSPHTIVSAQRLGKRVIAVTRPWNRGVRAKERINEVIRLPEKL